MFISYWGCDLASEYEFYWVIVYLLFHFWPFFNILCVYSLSRESIVDVEGTLSATPEKVIRCSQQEVEIIVTKV